MNQIYTSVIKEVNYNNFPDKYIYVQDINKSLIDLIDKNKDKLYDIVFEGIRAIDDVDTIIPIIAIFGYSKVTREMFKDDLTGEDLNEIRQKIRDSKIVDKFNESDKMLLKKYSLIYDFIRCNVIKWLKEYIFNRSDFLFYYYNELRSHDIKNIKVYINDINLNYIIETILKITYNACNFQVTEDGNFLIYKERFCENCARIIRQSSIIDKSSRLSDSSAIYHNSKSLYSIIDCIDYFTANIDGIDSMLLPTSCDLLYNLYGSDRYYSGKIRSYALNSSNSKFTTLSNNNNILHIINRKYPLTVQHILANIKKTSDFYRFYDSLFNDYIKDIIPDLSNDKLKELSDLNYKDKIISLFFNDIEDAIKAQLIDYKHMFLKSDKRIQDISVRGVYTDSYFNHNNRRSIIDDEVGNNKLIQNCIIDSYNQVTFYVDLSVKLKNDDDNIYRILLELYKLGSNNNYIKVSYRVMYKDYAMKKFPDLDSWGADNYLIDIIADNFKDFINKSDVIKAVNNTINAFETKLYRFYDKFYNVYYTQGDIKEFIMEVNYYYNNILFNIDNDINIFELEDPSIFD